MTEICPRTGICCQNIDDNLEVIDQDFCNECYWLVVPGVTEEDLETETELEGVNDG